jgi:hypothetical protein
MKNLRERLEHDEASGKREMRLRRFALGTSVDAMSTYVLHTGGASLSRYPVCKECVDATYDLHVSVGISSDDTFIARVPCVYRVLIAVRGSDALGKAA